jgi:hypothetical protein
MDEYILKRGFGGSGAYFFYKNGLLHREVGPAIIFEETEEEYKNRFLNLGDEHLYKEEIINSKYPLDYKEELFQEKVYIPSLKYAVDSHIVFSHYLNGKPYTPNEFKQIKVRLDLKNELNTELPNNHSNIKKPKV